VKNAGNICRTFGGQWNKSLLKMRIIAGPSSAIAGPSGATIKNYAPTRTKRTCVQCIMQRDTQGPPQSGTFRRGTLLSRRGQQTALPMTRSPNDEAQAVSVKSTDQETNDYIAELLAPRPLTMDTLFADPRVQMRIGMVITQAMDTRTSLRRRTSRRDSR
jgi:hypothetical protein